MKEVRDRPRRAARTAIERKLRLFFASWPPRETAAALHAWACKAQRAAGGRVTRGETIHLTLAFLGSVAPERADAAIAAARRARGERHVITMDHAECWRHNRIIWAGPGVIPAPLASFAGTLGAELEQENFALERRPLAAHVTLIRKARATDMLPAFEPVEWPVEEFVLVRSTLSAEGSRYDALERFALT